MLGEVNAFAVNKLSDLSSLLLNAAAVLAELDFPESLIHGDLTPWNVKLSGHGPVFLDWEDAVWGPAVLSVEIFLAALPSPRQIRDSGWLERIRGSYLSACSISSFLNPMDPLKPKFDLTHSS
jgi:Ser/Thr protein kinase RdoA (MazF antagonist)